MYVLAKVGRLEREEEVSLSQLPKSYSLVCGGRRNRLHFCVSHTTLIVKIHWVLAISEKLIARWCWFSRLGMGGRNFLLTRDAKWFFFIPPFFRLPLTQVQDDFSQSSWVGHSSLAHAGIESCRWRNRIGDLGVRSMTLQSPEPPGRPTNWFSCSEKFEKFEERSVIWRHSQLKNLWEKAKLEDRSNLGQKIWPHKGLHFLKSKRHNLECNTNLKLSRKNLICWWKRCPAMCPADGTIKQEIDLWQPQKQGRKIPRKDVRG